MRIVSFAEFLTMPEGTVFSFYQDIGNFGGLCVKLDTITGEQGPLDYFYKSLTSEIGGIDSDSDMDLLEKAQEPGASVPMVFDTVYREGLFDHDALYAVWSREDVAGLIKALEEAVT